MPSISRTAIGGIFFVLGSLLCSVIGDADLCKALRHVGTELLVPPPERSGVQVFEVPSTE